MLNEAREKFEEMLVGSTKHTASLFHGETAGQQRNGFLQIRYIYKG